MAVSEYAKVSFITTKSGRIPNMLKHTGALVVMSDVSKGSNNRHSIWLRGNLIGSGWGFSKEEYMKNGEWFAQAYNPIFSPTDEGASYFIPSKNIEDTPSIKYAEDGKTIVGMPQSIHMLLSYGIIYTDYSINEYSKVVDTKLNGLNTTITGISNKVDNIDKKLTSYISYFGTEIDNSRKFSYAYTKYWVDRIIGDAPEYLNSIKELNSWLQNNRDNALQTLGKIQELDKIKVSLDPETNGFTYISENQWYSEIDKDKSLTGWYAYTYYDDSDMSNPQVGTAYYSYNPSKVSYGGKISIKSSQVSTDDKWHNIPLDKILERLVANYNYKIPEVETPFIINNKTDKEWKEDVIEYGTNPSINSLQITVKLNDTSSMDIIMTPSVNFITSSKSNPLKSGTNDITSTIIVSDHPVVLLTDKQSLIDTIEKEFDLFSGYVVNYGDAVLQEYPQLKGIDDDNKIIDESGYKASYFTSSYPISKKYNWKVYWGCSEEVPTNEALLTKTSSKFIEKTTTGKMTTETSHSKLWICLPSLLLDESKIIMRSWTSGIENDLTSIDTDMIKKKIVSEFMYKGMTRYSTVQIENLEFTMFADKVSMEVIFN